MTGPADSKDQASQSPPLNQREKPRRIGIFICLVGILVGGAAGEYLREWMVSALHQNSLFTALSNSPEVQKALAARDAPSAADGMVPVNGTWAKDLYWKDGHVAYFVLADGTFLFESPRPPTWAFPLVLLFPVLGGLIPWAIMKSLSWMGVPYFAKNRGAAPVSGSS